MTPTTGYQNIGFKNQPALGGSELVQQDEKTVTDTDLQ